MRKSKIYKIKWIDSQSEDGWTFYKHRKDTLPMIITSVGFKIHETKKLIRLALSYGSNPNGLNEQFNGSIIIPKCCILKSKKIK